MISRTGIPQTGIPQTVISQTVISQTGFGENQATEPTLAGHNLFFGTGTVLALIEACLFTHLSSFWAGFTLAVTLLVCSVCVFYAHKEADDYEAALSAAINSEPFVCQEKLTK